MQVRRILTVKDVVFADPFGQQNDPITRLASAAVVRNPISGQFVDDLSALFDIGGSLGDRLMSDLVSGLPGAPVSYGKAAIVGVAGDMEHGGALVHPKLGKPMRAAVGGGKSLIPSNVKIGSAGTAIDVPLGHKDDAWSFAHFDTMTVMVPDAPLPDEIVMIMAVADGGRPNPRVGTGPITD
ncbi:MAG: amino acid synthesis family protein [Alphaproteobacteria bacterium]|nr:amino acid synthesis family protein [Alphaproteobacteria bacterium]